MLTRPAPSDPRSATGIPHRQPPFDKAQRRGRRLGRLLAGYGAKLSPQLWQQLGEGYRVGDAAADQLVEWMMRAGARDTHPLLARAIRDGVDAVPNAPTELRAFFATVESTPDWLDQELLREGARVCHMGGTAGHYVLRDGGLMPGYLAPAINRTLILTGALQRGPRRRLAETMKWWLDCTADNGMQRGGPGWQSTLHVRMMHAFVRRRVLASPQWDSEQWGLPVNQTDMAGTYLVFAIAFLLGLRVSGVPITRAEGRAVMHFWRYVCWLIGVDEDWLVNTEAEGRNLLWHIAVSQPEPDETCIQLGQALMNEPLQRHYPNFAWLRGHFERQKHLSMTRLFASAEQMRALGLPDHVLPWFPLAMLPLNLGWNLANRALPGGRERLIRRGRLAQEALVQRHFGPEAQEVGALNPA
jgi:hypothetical protein